MEERMSPGQDPELLPGGVSQAAKPSLATSRDARKSPAWANGRPLSRISKYGSVSLRIAS